jgi:hypothetical protein
VFKNQVYTVALLSSLLAPGCLTMTHDVGWGFAEVRREHPTSRDTSVLSSRYHLYYRSRDLGRVDWHSISPSGGYALFERHGKIFLFIAPSRSIRLVGEAEFAFLGEVSWNEPEGKARVTGYSVGPGATADGTRVVWAPSTMDVSLGG